MTSVRRVTELRYLYACSADLANWRGEQPIARPIEARMRPAVLLLLVAAIVAVMSVQARAQSLPSLGDSAVTADITSPTNPDLAYAGPTPRTKLGNYVFDAFGPYPIAGAAFTAGIDQWTNTPPEWNQGLKGFSRRFGSDFAIAAVGTTTRYGLAEAFKEDTLYYRCNCRGPFPRLRHAVTSTLTGHRRRDGHRVFSFSALAAPYAGSVTAVYGWYPNRFGAKDAFRMGNYSLLEYMGGNIALEFLYGGPHSLRSRMHLNSAHGSPVQEPKQ